MSASRIFRAIWSCSSCSGRVSLGPGPFSIINLKSFAISSGRFKTDSVTPVIKYQELAGNWGCPRIEDNNAGVTSAGRLAACMLLRSDVSTDNDTHAPFTKNHGQIRNKGISKRKSNYTDNDEAMESHLTCKKIHTRLPLCDALKQIRNFNGEPFRIYVQYA